jgi:hypothetical protein
MKTLDAVKHLIKVLKKDEGYRESWKASIAMAFKDSWDWYSKKKRKTVMNKLDRHIISNEAAEYFLTLLCLPNEKENKHG